MLFGCAFGEGLEPVGDMGYAVFQSPFLHPGSHLVGSSPVEGHAIVDALEKRLAGGRIQIPAHFVAVENKLAIITRNLAFGSIHGYGLLFESFPHEFCPVLVHATDYKMFIDCSRIFSSSSFIFTTVCCMPEWLALEPVVLISRPIS